MRILKSTGIILILFVVLSGSSILQAQEGAFSFDFGSDVVSRYIWRGVEFGVSENSSSTPHFQPNASFSYSIDASSFTLGMWASYGFDGKYNENDLYLNYSLSSEAGTLSLTINDYYYPFYGIDFTNFDRDGLGGHTVELNFSYSLPESFPLTVVVSSNVHNDVPDNKSLYFELSYPLQISSIDLTFFAGAANGPSVWHTVEGDGFKLINTGFSASKSLKISDSYSLPLGMSWIFNPHLKKTYLVFKVSI